MTMEILTQKQLKAIKDKEYYEKNKDRIKQRVNNYYRNNKEVCQARNKEYQINNADTLKVKSKIYRESNKENTALRVHSHYLNNIDKYKNRAKIHAINNRQSKRNSQKKFRENNKEKVKLFNKNWVAKNIDKVRYYVRTRQSKKLMATPLWVNKDKILEIYKLAKYLEMATGISHHVDHIVPIKSKIVCGLHCEFNLQVITKQENLSKGNKWII